MRSLGLALITAAALGLGVFTMLVATKPAHSQAMPANCTTDGPAALEAAMKKVHGEVPFATLQSANQGRKVLIFAKPDGSTYTVLVRLPNGVVCSVDSGTDLKSGGEGKRS